jgi:hypothetical protein
MKKLLILVSTVFLLGSCSVFDPNPEFSEGMSEKKFLRQNKEAVLSGIDGNLKTYRVNRGERFYILATFEDDKLIKLEEIESYPQMMDNIPNDGKSNNLKN